MQNYKETINIDTKKKCHNDLIIAQFGAPHGILGWTRVFSFTEKKINIFNYYPWNTRKEKIKIIIHVQHWKRKKKHFIVKMKDITNRSIAKTFTNCYITINENILPPLKNNDYYWKDIIGCIVFNLENKKLGIVISLIKTSSNDILIINEKKENKIKQDILIPLVNKKIIKKIEIDKKIIIVDWNYTFKSR
ncbi:MAG: ribosome maturation factor RimM [Buchnera aphidicola (Meitanaphis elongallis)]